MTKKTKQESLSMLNRHHSERIQRADQEGSINSLSLKKSSNLKKSIRKPQQQLQLIDKVQLLKQKSHRFYKHAQKKIDRMIQIIDEIDEKHLMDYANKNRTGNHLNQNDGEGQFKSQSSGSNPQAISDSAELTNQAKHSYVPSAEERQLITKTLTHLHNLLTYQKPLTHIKHEFQSFYSKLSAFAKQLQPEKPLPDDKKFLVNEKGLTFQEIRGIQQLIKEHYLRAGYFSVAGMFDRYGKQQGVISNNEISQKAQKQDSNLFQRPQSMKFQQIMNLVSSNNQNHNHNHSNTNKLTHIKKKTTTKNSPIKPKKKKQPTNNTSLIKRKPKVTLIDLQDNFKQCFTLRHQLLNKNFNQAINWCVQQRLYQTHSNPLEYQLRLAQIKLLIYEKKYRMVFDKIQKEMVKFLQNYEDEINLLIGFLLFSCEWNAQKVVGGGSISGKVQQNDDNHDNEIDAITQEQHQLFTTILTTRYSSFSITTVTLPQLAQKFTHQYFIHYGISQFDTLEICYQVGKMYEQQYFDSIKMFSEKDRQEFLAHRGQCQFNDRHNVPHSVILPFEIPVDKQYLYHSIFVCPVTKEVLSSNDGVEFLSCGHLVSESAKKNMAEVRRSNHKQKCPVCQKDRAAEVVKVRF